MSEKKIQGFYNPDRFKSVYIKVTKWCWCKNCDTKWYEEFESLNGVVMNGPYYYDYCSECKGEKQDE